jgi:uncharacterized repeat protein (TIGR01451 family)
MNRRVGSGTSHSRLTLTLMAGILLVALSSLERITIPSNAESAGAMPNPLLASPVAGQLAVAPPAAAATPAVGATFTVTTANDGGSNSLRQAIIDANASPDLDKIVFDIPGSGIQMINLTSSLPTITSPVIIDGYSQPGASPNTLADGDDAVLLIEINGASAGTNTNGLTISAGGSVIRGLIITGFRFSGIVLVGSGDNRIEGNFVNANGTRGVTIEDNASNNLIGGVTPDTRNVISGNGRQGVRILPGSSANRVQGNFIGVDRSGMVAAGNFNEGVLVAGSGNLIGGQTPGARNVISASLSGSGVGMVTSAATDNQIRGNYIGTNANGTTPLGNRQEGALLDQGATNNTIGGTSPADRNIISGNGQNGIVIGFNSAANGNRILNNFIGTGPDGVSPLGNRQAGISIASSSNNAIGDQDGNGNRIAFNLDAGVRIFSGINNAILSNSIFSNGRLGIDFFGDGVTPNDPGDADSGPNNLQNYPQLVSVTPIFNSRVIAGTLNSAPNTTYTVQFFANDACDDSGSGEGQQLIATRTVTTDATGNAGFSFTVAGSFAQVITATATDPAGNTSEFSACSLNSAATNLVVTKTASTNTLRPGDDLIYTITATNNGPALATNVTLFDTLPASVTFVSCTASAGGLCLGNDNARRITFATLLPGTSATATLTVRVNDALEDGTVITNTATLRSLFADDTQSSSTSTVAVTVDRTAPALNCPASLTLNAGASQCGVTAQYGVPTVQGLANAIVNCSPPSGATFPVGVTVVSCMASDSRGPRATCGFTVVVNAPPTVNVALEGGGAALEFGPVAPVRKVKKSPPSGCACSRTFIIENAGCAALEIDLATIMRTGSDVDSGKISDPDDSRFFLVTVIEADGAEKPASCAHGPASCIHLDPGQKVTFRVVFRPLIPAAFSGRTRRLAASDVLPAKITSKIIFKQSSGATVEVALVARVTTEIRLVDPEQPRRPARVVLSRLDDQFTVTYAIFDADLDAKRARYEFFDEQGRQIGEAIEVDLAEAIKEANIVTGQSFIVTQRFSGARANPQVANVRVTVFDAQSSDSAKGSLN